MDIITIYDDQEPALVEVRFSLSPRDWRILENQLCWKQVKEYLSVNEYYEGVGNEKLL